MAAATAAAARKGMTQNSTGRTLRIRRWRTLQCLPVYGEPGASAPGGRASPGADAPGSPGCRSPRRAKELGQRLRHAVAVDAGQGAAALGEQLAVAGHLVAVVDANRRGPLDEDADGQQVVEPR